MSKLLIHKDIAALFVHEHLFVVKTTSGSSTVHEYPTQDHPIQTIAFNRSGSLLLCLTQDKTLTVFDLKTDEKVSSKVIPRKALSIACGYYADEKEAVVVGDNTGEVLALPIPNVDQGLESLLQHTTSMITSVALSDDSKFLVSADRDEKIRVSRFPKAVITEGYCLGHTAFVSHVVLSNVDPELMISIGGDGTLRLWSYQQAKLLDTHQIPLEDSDKPECTPIALAISPDHNIVIAAIKESKTMIVCPFGKENFQKTEQSIKFAGQPVDITISATNEVFVTYDSEPYVQVYKLEANATLSLMSDSHVAKKLRGCLEKALAAEDDANPRTTSDDVNPMKKRKINPHDWKTRLETKVNKH